MTDRAVPAEAPVVERVAIRTSDGHVVEAWRGHDPGGAPVDARPAVILCHGFVQNRFAFESPSVSMAAHLRGLGYAVWSVELRGRACEQALGHCFAEYVELDAPAVVAEVAKRHGRVAWIGHSMGGLVAVSMADAAKDKLAAIVTIGAPLLPAKHPIMRRPVGYATLVVGRVVSTATKKPFRGRRYGRALHALRVVLDHPRAKFPFQVWAPGSLDPRDLAYVMTETFCDDSYGALADLADLALTDGERAGRIPVGARLRSMKTPLLVVGADRDGLAPLQSTRPLFQRAGSADKEFLEVSARTTGFPVGHVDLLVGKRAPQYVWPGVDAFLARHLRA